MLVACFSSYLNYCTISNDGTEHLNIYWNIDLISIKIRCTRLRSESDDIRTNSCLMNRLHIFDVDMVLTHVARLCHAGIEVSTVVIVVVALGRSYRR